MPNRLEEIIAWCNQSGFVCGAKDVVKAVNQAFGFENDELSSESRKGEFAEARKVYAWYSIRITKATEEPIGWRINKSRSAIISAIKAANNLIDAKDETFIANLEKVYIQLKQLK